MSPAQGLQVVGPNEENEFVCFWSWLRGRTKLRIKLVGLASIVVPLLAIVDHLTGIFTHANSVAFGTPRLSVDPVRLTYGLQIVMIFAIWVVHAAFVRPLDAQQYEIGSNGQARLKFWWSVALCSFLLLYIFFG